MKRAVSEGGEDEGEGEGASQISHPPLSLDGVELLGVFRLELPKRFARRLELMRAAIAVAVLAQRRAVGVERARRAR